MITPTDKIWHNGRMIAWNDAKIHVLAHVTSYGSSWFEGIRCYATDSGPAIFRLDEHVRRLHDSAKIYRVELPFSHGELCAAMLDVVSVNKLKSCYLRPLVIRGYGNMGVMPTKDNPIETYIAAWEWGKYLGEEAIDQWRRRLRLQLGPHGPQYPARPGQGRGQLHELAADPHGSRG